MPPRTPRQPKLRASCDGCGAAKLRCDRNRPQCGRCRLVGRTCVYGVSRKMGKPPRDKLRLPKAPSESRTGGHYPNSVDKDRRRGVSRISGTNGSVGDGIYLNSKPFPRVNELPSAWGEVDSYLNNLTTSTNTPDTMPNSLLGPSSLDSTSLNFDGDLAITKVEDGHISTLGSSGLKSYSTPIAHIRPSQTELDENICLESPSIPLASSNDHDCSWEAYRILGSLSFLRLDKAGFTPQSTPSSISSLTGTVHRVSFDHLLRLNRESSERLVRLLTCSCSRCPHLALLYTSIISLILTRYQQAASCNERAIFNRPTVAADNMLPYISPAPSMCGSKPTWSSTSISGASTPATIESDMLTVAPTQLAIGSFNIDDPQVQTALKLQLLLGEMKRTGALIDLFASWGSSAADDFTFNGVDSLHKSLVPWLRREHSRVADMMRFRLREASI